MMNNNDDDVIETSEDAEDEGKGGLYPYDPTQADIDIRETPHTIFEIMRKYDDGRLIIEPDFQRRLVWKPEQKSRFIESIISLYRLFMSMKPEKENILLSMVYNVLLLYMSLSIMNSSLKD